MAKLYAEITSDKGGRVASKGGDNTIKIELKEGNKIFATIFYSIGSHLGTSIEVYSPKDKYTLIK